MKRLAIPVVLIAVFVMASVAGAVYIAFGQSADAPKLYLTPDSGTVVPDSEIVVGLRVSSSESLRAIEATLGYDPTQLQPLGFAETGPFSQILSSDIATPGQIRVARGVPVTKRPISGDDIVTTVRFKVLATGGSAVVGFDDRSSLALRSPDSKNILATTAGTKLSISGQSLPGRLSLIPSSSTVKKGEDVVIDLVQNTGSAFSNTVAAEIVYDTSALQYTGFNEATAPGVKAILDGAVRGRITVNRSLPQYSGIMGENSIVKLNFKVLADSGVTSLKVDKQQSSLYGIASAENLLATTSGAELTLRQAAPVLPTTTAQKMPSNKVELNCKSAPSLNGGLRLMSSGYSNVRLTWRPADSTAQCGIAGYRLLREGVAVAEIKEGTIFTDQNLKAGTEYSYTVSAVDTAGRRSAESAALKVTTKADDQAPFKPQGLTVAANDGAGVGLRWTPAVDAPNPGGVGSAYINIYRNGEAKPRYTTTNNGSFTDSDVSANTNYSYVITAVDAAGNESAPTNSATVRTILGVQKKAVPKTAQAAVVPKAGMRIALWPTGQDEDQPVISAGTAGEVRVEAPIEARPVVVQPDGVRKIEYSLNGRTRQTATVAPYAYRLDGPALANGRYQLTAKIYYTNGQTATVGQTLAVQNVFDTQQFRLQVKKHLIGIVLSLFVTGLLIMIVMVKKLYV